ncbi:DUF2442 domain-containing protein [Salmonella enterica]|nr:DUF2442 domain-containing protein [Salmonella enterica]
MYISANRVWFSEGSLFAELEDGRTIGAPIVWFPRLAQATSEQLAEVEIFPGGLHWPQLDEDISIDGLLAGRGAFTPHPHAA